MATGETPDDDQAPPPAAEDIAAAREAVNDAARLVRGLAFTFLLVGLYIFILGAQTSHEQLLRAAPIELPLLGVEVGIVQAYVLAPVLFLVLHVNLLVQYALLNDRIRSFNATIQGLPEARRRDECHRLTALPFVALRTPHPPEPPVRWLLQMVVWTNVVVAPVVVLLWCQIRFLPYQDPLVTPWHQLLLVADVVAVWLLAPRLAPAPPDGFPARRAARPLAMTLIHGLALVLALFVAVPRPLGWLLVDGNGIPRDLHWPAPVGIELDAVAARELKPLGQHLLGEDAPFARDDGENEPWLDRLLRIDRRLIVRDRILMEREPPPEVYTRYRAEAGDDADGGDEAAQRDPDHAEPLDLTGRNLRFADLREAVLPGALLDDADVRSAVLLRAELPDATMVDARLQGADLRDARLQDADLPDARLQGANLRDAQLQGAGLAGARLQGAVLAGARLQGADLSDARLPGADLSAAGLQGTNLGDAQLQGADLRRARLQGADLSVTRLQGAHLAGARLQGADLRRAQLQGADLRGALQGADLSDARLQGADLRGSGWWGARLNDETRLDWADLRGRDIETPFEDAAEQAAWIEEAVATIDDPNVAEHVRERLRTGSAEDIVRGPRPPVGLLDGSGQPVDDDTSSAHWQPRAEFLGDIACADDMALEGARGIARMFLWEFGNAYYAPRDARAAFARRLLADDCGPMRDAGAAWRARLERIAAEGDPAAD